MSAALRTARGWRQSLRFVPPAVLVGALLGAAEPRRPVSVFSVTPTDAFGRLRIFAKPGDLALRTATATAVVRASDGVLVDFFPHEQAASTVPQLDGATDLDGLWTFETSLVTGNQKVPVRSSHTRATAEGVSSRAVVKAGPSRLVVVTTYAVSPTEPAVTVTTRVEHASGPEPLKLTLEDTVRWGNVACHAGGHGLLPATFSGQTTWVGRKGAAGDLVLRAEPEAPFQIQFATDNAGFRAPVKATYAWLSVPVGGTATFARRLSYEPIAPEVDRSPRGLLRATLTDEAGKPLAAKLSFRGVDGTADPSFGDDGGLDGAGRFAWSGTGNFERSLRPGRYEVLATAGIERDAARWVVDVREGATVSVEGKLPRVIETPGYISADLHLHQAPSVDADISFAGRVVSIAAEGVEFAVATDHYAVTDLGPTISALRRKKALATPVRSMVGTEVSTTGYRFGHFNVFPVPMDARFDYDDTTPARLFAQMRAASPRGIIQVNHPRWENIGYFRLLRLDTQSGASPAHLPHYSPEFDTIEVYNGLDVATRRGLFQVLTDFRRLLERGHRYSATGNSDSHKLFFLDPGVPRNLIRWGDAGDDANDLEAPTEAILDGIRRGRMIVTSGPIVEASVAGKGPGETAVVPGGAVELLVRVRAAPWIDVRRVAVLVGANEKPVAERAFAPSSAVVRFEEAFRFTVKGPTFVIVIADGSTELPNVHAAGSLPFAFTNPIYVEPATAKAAATVP